MFLHQRFHTALFHRTRPQAGQSGRRSHGSLLVNVEGSGSAGPDVAMLADDLGEDNKHMGGKNPAKRGVFFSFQNNLYNENRTSDFAMETISCVKTLQESYCGMNVKNWLPWPGSSVG